MMKKLVLTIISMIVLSTLLLFSVDKQEKREIFRSLGDETRLYMEDNIHSQLDEWKNQIDSELSADDLKLLNEMRANKSEMKANKRASMKKKRDNRGMNFNCDGNSQGKMKNRKNAPNQEKRNQFRQFNEECIVELSAIIDNYPDFFENLFAEVSQKQNQWKEDLKEIRDNWLEENKAILEDNPNGRKNRMLNNNKFENRFQNPEQVLLWDGAPLRMPARESRGTLIETSNSPNPFTESTHIMYNIPKSGIYKIEVINTNGNSVEVLHNGHINEGEYTIVFNPKDLLPGVYFYKISGEGYEQTNKMLLTK